MGNVLSNRATAGLENEMLEIGGFIALDGASNVIGYAPTATPPTAVGPYTRLKGAQKSIGPAGGVILQPHTGVGVYILTLDEFWNGGTEFWVQLADQGAVAAVNYFVDANVTANQSGGAYPGQNPALTPGTIRIRFRTAAAGALADPVASTGFWFGCQLKRGGW